jgi:pimeloyl-ACP methyl ester carboxylesterase
VHRRAVSLHTPFVFVHGLFGSFSDPAAFRQLAPAACSAPDLDGYGATAGRTTITVPGQVAALRAHIASHHPDQRVHLVAHSIGAVYAFTLADMEPDLVAGVTSVEGNFTLADAFWSRSIAALDEEAARQAITQRLSDPVAYLAGDGIAPTGDLVSGARAALAYQPWRTVWESAAAIVEATGSADYLTMVQRVFDRTDVFLVAGERSAPAWNVPGWARGGAAGSATVSGVGHMMLERPEALGRAIGRLVHEKHRTA